MKDVQMDVPYISIQLNWKNSSPILFNKILCKNTKNGFRNSPKLEFWFLELEFGMLDWDWVELSINYARQKNAKFIYVLCTNLWMAQIGKFVNEL